jgi:hypothetical protein
MSARPHPQDRNMESNKNISVEISPRSNDSMGLFKESADMTDTEGTLQAVLDLLSTKMIRRICRALSLKDAGNRAQNIIHLKLLTKGELTRRTIRPIYESEIGDVESVHGAGLPNDHNASIVNGLIHNTTDSDGNEDSPRHALPRSPKTKPSKPTVNWLSPTISAAAIRRECASRIPIIQIPTRMLAKEVKAKYGPMLMQLNKGKRQNRVLKHQSPEAEQNLKDITETEMEEDEEEEEEEEEDEEEDVSYASR